MNEFTYAKAATVSEAIREVSQSPQTYFLGGGTNLIDLVKYGVEIPDRLIDITRLPLNRIEALPGGGLRVGAMVRNSDLAADPRIRQAYPVLSQALLAGASPQLRNMATTGGNLLQRTRCYYFYDPAFACNKRKPGSGCSAINGYNRIHAILGSSPQCAAVHPSDMAVALAALDAVVQVEGPKGRRGVPILDFHRLPGDTPNIDTNLGRGEIITAVDLPESPVAARSTYIKVRDRASYAFALISVAAALEVSGETIREARLALGGVAHKPWRALDAEATMIGHPAGQDTFHRAAEAALRDAKPLKHNGFKVELAKRTIVRALSDLNGGRT